VTAHFTAEDAEAAEAAETFMDAEGTTALSAVNRV
jgi:hypothetical protein